MSFEITIEGPICAPFLARPCTKLVACRSFYTHPPPTYTPHYPLQLPFTPPGSSQPIPYLEIPLEIPLAPGLVPMRGEVAAPPAIGPPER